MSRARSTGALGPLGLAGRGGWEGSHVCALTNFASTQVFVLTDFRHGQSVYIARAAHTLRRGRPVLQKPAHLLRATIREA